VHPREVVKKRAAGARRMEKYLPKKKKKPESGAPKSPGPYWVEPERERT